jgi:hypothetical protein
MQHAQAIAVITHILTLPVERFNTLEMLIRLFWVNKGH